jgi:hypothetical protein
MNIMLEMNVKERVLSANLGTHENQVYQEILAEFANGEKPTIQSIMSGLGANSENIIKETIRKLEKIDLLTHEGSNITSAYPYSAIETPHKVIFENQKEVYALCATDSIGIHFMTKKNIVIESVCPQCGDKINIQVKNGEISSENKDIIEFISYQERGCCTAENLCPFLNFFCSRDHLKKWKLENPELKKGLVLNLPKALELSKKVFSGLI